MTTYKPAFIALYLGLIATCGNVRSFAIDRLEFNRDIRIILSDNCFSCHGPDEKGRQAGLRLDLSEPSKARLESGKVAIAPGNIAESELVRRILSTDVNEVMPPPDSGKHLTPKQIELLRQWIAQGAEYQKHWSFVALTRPMVPAVTDANSLGPIDAIVRDRLKHDGLKSAPQASKPQLIRRVTFDLTGTPPTPAEVDDFVADPSPDAYERVVDRLLASPRYGERMALDWLDAARYADTHGFNNDTTRYMWRWRDWTINAFNQGLPFDQFVTDQLAGDLLPNPTLDQRIATGFNRNHVINSEGGIIPEEYRVEYVADRVHTTATIFLGLSMGCTRCHDHKFDPLTQKEFYQFFAFFNQLNEQGEAGRVGNAEPMIKAPTPEQSERMARLTASIRSLDQSSQQRIAAATKTISEWEPKLRESVAAKSEETSPKFRWTLDETSGVEVADNREPSRKGAVVGKAEWSAGRINGAFKFDGATHIELGDIASFERSDRFSCGAWINMENKDAGAVIARMDDAEAFRGFDLLVAGGKLTAHLIHHWPDNALHVISKAEIPTNQWKHVLVTYDGSSKGEGLKLYFDGKLQEVEITNNHLTETTLTTKPLRIGRRTPGSPFRGLIDDVRIYDCELTDSQIQTIIAADGLSDLLATPSDKRAPHQMDVLVKGYLNRFDAEYQSWMQQRSGLETQKTDLEKSIPSAMVMQDMPEPRSTYVLKRGQYDAPGEEVKPDVPASLPPFPAGAPRNRLGLAQWLLTPEHPLTARVAVNRAWMQLFGTGLVETVEDFGSQGQWPTHLDLLDWLSMEYSGFGSQIVVSGQERPRWDTKRLYRLIVNSATYRQSSAVSPELMEQDPANKLLARGPRFRLQAELIRDNALSVAGLLSDRIGGPSVSPYQPAGLWDDVAVGADYEGTVYKQDKGEGLYRRSMYTFWKRTCPPPGMNTFDAPEREVCTARRSRTNTPLQALVLLNDPTYLEAARKLAERAILAGGQTDQSKLEYAYKLAFSRGPAVNETMLLLKIYQSRLAHFRQNPADAKALIAVGESARDAAIDEADLAAWTSVMSLLLNLDEAITKG